MRLISMSHLARLLATVALLSTGQLMIKHGLTLRQGEPFGLSACLSPWVIAGIASVACSSLFYFSVLRELPLSVVFPFISLTYVVVMLASALLFEDRLTAARLAGMGFIVIGIVLLSR